MSVGEVVMPVAQPKTKTRKRITGVGIVKAVTSGDSMVLMGGLCENGIPSEKHITLSGVIAPLFARSRNAKDVDFAFLSREYLRKKVIGKRVRFVIHHTASQGGRPRNYADIVMDGHDLSLYMLRAGLVQVKMPNSPEAKIHPEKQHLIDIMEEVKKQGLGMWNTRMVNQVRDVNWYPDPRTLFEENKGKPIKAIIDHVREGHVFRVELLGPNLAHTMINLQLAGVHTPKVPKPHYILIQEWERDNKVGKKPVKQQAEPFALEARFYSEARLLHRDVEIYLLGIDKLGNFFGTVKFAMGNISVKLLENGLGKIIKWSAKLNDETSYLRLLTAERLAKQRRAYLWADYDEKKEEQDNSSEFMGTVLQVNSGDSLQVLNSTTHETVRINLASIRCPRLGYNGMRDEPYAMDAREFVRTRVIGKRVQVQVEYSRRNGRNGKELLFCSVLFNQSDLAEGLVMQGFASVIRHRETEPRSSRYEKLVCAEEHAVTQTKGIFGKNLPAVKVIEDLTARKGGRRRRDNPKDADKEKDAEKDAAPVDSRARLLFPFLKRKESINGVCEYAFSGSRLKVYLPEHNCIIPLILAGIRTPSNNGNNQDPENLAQVVKTYVGNKLMQRSIRVNVVSSDKADNFVGGVWMGRTNMAVHLVQKGYASVFSYSAEKTSYREQLFQAQSQAKEQKLGIWKNWVRPVTPVHSDNSDDEQESTQIKKLREGEEFINVKITEINDPNNFYVQIVGDTSLELVTQQMAQFSEDIDDTFDPDMKIENGVIYAGKFTPGDDLWYRVRCEGKTVRGTYRSFFMDYGNRAELSLDKLRVLPKHLSSVAPLSRMCCLAGLVTPFAADHLHNAIHDFGDLCFNRQLLAKVELAEKTGKLHLNLLEPNNPLSINNQLLRAGSLRVDERPNARLNKAFIAALQESQTLAKQDFLGVWEYGDVSDSDGEEGTSKRYDGRVPRKKF